MFSALLIIKLILCFWKLYFLARCLMCAVDASEAGTGNLEIMINNGQIPCTIVSNGRQKFRASFVPKEATVHFVALKFNGIKVQGVCMINICIVVLQFIV